MGTGAIGHVKLSILPRRLLDGAHFSKKLKMQVGLATHD